MPRAQENVPAPRPKFYTRTCYRCGTKFPCLVGTPFRLCDGCNADIDRGIAEDCNEGIGDDPRPDPRRIPMSTFYETALVTATAQALDTGVWESATVCAEDVAEMLRELVRLREEITERKKYDIREYILEQMAWSGMTFGHGRRIEGVCRHMEKEIHDIRAAPSDVSEWCDVTILSLDGAWRQGNSPQQIADALLEKQARNFARSYPKTGDDEPSEHDRSLDALPKASDLEAGEPR